MKHELTISKLTLSLMQYSMNSLSGRKESLILKMDGTRKRIVGLDSAMTSIKLSVF
jgi:hypothetical protein